MELGEILSIIALQTLPLAILSLSITYTYILYATLLSFPKIIEEDMATFEYFIQLRSQTVFFWAAILLWGLCMR